MRQIVTANATIVNANATIVTPNAKIKAANAIFVLIVAFAILSRIKRVKSKLLQKQQIVAFAPFAISFRKCI